jgi:hypothetical protein
LNADNSDRQTAGRPIHASFDPISFESIWVSSLSKQADSSHVELVLGVEYHVEKASDVPKLMTPQRYVGME